MRKLFSVLAAVFVFVSCENASMKKLVEKYNALFIPSEDILWTEENIKNNSLDIAAFKEMFDGKTFEISKNADLFIIGGPVNCETYIWTLHTSTGITKNFPNRQILNLEIHSREGILGDGSWNESGSLDPNDYRLSLEVVKDGTRYDPWTATLKVTN